MAGRTNRALLRVHSIPMGRPKPSHPPQTVRGQVSPRKTKGAVAVKTNQVEFQKQKVEELCEFLLGKASLSDNIFNNCQNSLKSLQLSQADILKEVPWAKDLTLEQNHFAGLVSVLMKEFQRQRAEIERLVSTISSQERLMEYRSKQIKELQNHYEIQILAKEEEKQNLSADLHHLKAENRDLQEQNKKCLEIIENNETQLLSLKQNQEKLQSSMSMENIACEIKPCTRKLHSSSGSKSSLSLSGSVSSSRFILSRETTRKSMKSDFDHCDSPVSFANSDNSPVPSAGTQRDNSNMSDLSFANSTHSEEQQQPCLLCSQTFNTTKTFLCKQCIDKFKIN